MNVEQTDGPNVVLVGSSSNPTDNFDDNVEEHFSSATEFDDDDVHHTNENENENTLPNFFLLWISALCH